MDKKKKLFMSVKILDTNDIVPGFGGKELLISLISAGVGLIVGLVVYFMSASLPKSIIGGVLIVIGVVLLVVRDQCNESLIDKVGFMISYYRSEKHFEFKYYDSLKEEMLELEEREHDS